MNLSMRKIATGVGFILTAPNIAHADLIFKDDQLEILTRNFHFYREYENGGSNPSGANSQLPSSERNKTRNEWAQGFVAKYSSGYTDTPIQLGFEAYGLLGVKLYSDIYETGTLLLQYDPTTGKTKSTYGEVGGALKLKYKDTVITYGDQFPYVPVLATSTVRLLPTVSTGVSLQDKSFNNLLINAGYFYSMNPLDSTKDLNYFTTDYGAGIRANSISYVGGTYTFPQASLTAYVSELEDVWNQVFVGGTYLKKIDEDQKLKLGFTGFSNTDTGKKNGGDIEAYIFSAMTDYSYKNHTFSLGYQQVFGNEPFDIAGFSSAGSNNLNYNVAQYSTFSEAHEKSLQVKYEVEMTPYGIPGLTLMGRYFYGWDIDNSHSNNPFYTKRYVYDPSIDYIHRETNLQAAYKVQSGFAKGLDFKLRYASSRATKGYRYDDIDELRTIVEYTFKF